VFSCETEQKRNNCKTIHFISVSSQFQAAGQSHIASSVVCFVAALVPHAVGDVTLNGRRRRRRHPVSHSTLEPVVERLAVQTVPERRAAALVAGGAVEAGACVLAG